MAEEPIISIDLKQLERIPKVIRLIEKRGGVVDKPLKRFVIFMKQETEKTFRSGGRGDVKWKALAKITIIMRGFRKGGGKRTGPKRILQDTGGLKRSIRGGIFKRKGAFAAFMAAKAPHAKTHQFGGTIEIPERIIRAKNAQALKFNIGGRTVFAKKVVQPAKTKKVPKRQFLFFTTKDVKKARGLLIAHAREVVTKAVRVGVS